MSDIKIVKLPTGELAANCYICYREKNCVIIDAGDGYGVISDKLNELKLTPSAVLLTHGHFDHCMSAKRFQDAGAKVYIHEADADKLYSHKNLALMCGLKFDYLTADVLLKDGDELNISNMSFKVIRTEGHSAGSVCFVSDEARCVFCGDLLFKLSYGRTDFYDGDFNALLKSVKKIFGLPDDYVLYCGHGDDSTIGYEKKFNEILIDGGLR